MPATFTIAPSGARFPFRPTTPPVTVIGLSAGRTTSWCGFHFTALEVLGDGPARDRQAVTVHVAIIEKRLHQKRYATCFEHIFGDITAARLQICDIRRLLEDFGDVKQVELDAAFVRDRRQVQRGIGRTAGCGNDGGSVFQRLAA